VALGGHRRQPQRQRPHQLVIVRNSASTAACEPQRDSARTDTVAEVVDIVLTSRLLNGI
jgi:hypothetical protein